MDKSVELIVEEWKAVVCGIAKTEEALEQQQSELKLELKQQRKEKARKERALKALGWKLNSDGSVVEIEDNCVTQKDVHDLAVTVVKANPSITPDKLERFVNHKLSEDRELDMKGIGLRWKEVWQSETFSVAADGKVVLTNGNAVGSGQRDSKSESQDPEMPVESSAGFRKSR